MYHRPHSPNNRIYERIRTWMRARGLTLISEDELARLQRHTWERQALLDGLYAEGIILVPIEHHTIIGWTWELAAPLDAPSAIVGPQAYRLLRPIVRGALLAYHLQAQSLLTTTGGSDVKPIH